MLVCRLTSQFQELDWMEWYPFETVKLILKILFLKTVILEHADYSKVLNTDSQAQNHGQLIRLKKYPDVALRDVGFPEKWEQNSFWKF